MLYIVSIPYRHNEIKRKEYKTCQLIQFQFLIGTMKYSAISAGTHVIVKFQFLIGTMKCK